MELTGAHQNRSTIFDIKIIANSLGYWGIPVKPPSAPGTAIGRPGFVHVDIKYLPRMPPYRAATRPFRPSFATLSE